MSTFDELWDSPTSTTTVEEREKKKFDDLWDSTPAPTHTMPDGTVMPGAEHPAPYEGPKPVEITRQPAPTGYPELPGFGGAEAVTTGVSAEPAIPFSPSALTDTERVVGRARPVEQEPIYTDSVEIPFAAQVTSLEKETEFLDKPLTYAAEKAGQFVAAHPTPITEITNKIAAFGGRVVGGEQLRAGRGEVKAAEVEKEERTPEQEEQIVRGKALADKAGITAKDVSWQGILPIYKDNRKLAGLKPVERQDVTAYLMSKRGERGAVLEEKGAIKLKAAEILDPTDLKVEKVRRQVDKLAEMSPGIGASLKEGDIGGALDMLLVDATLGANPEARKEILRLRDQFQVIAQDKDKESRADGLAKVMEDAAKSGAMMAKSAAISTIPILGPIVSTSMWVKQGAGEIIAGLEERGINPEEHLGVIAAGAMIYGAIEQVEVNTILGKHGIGKGTIDRLIKNRVMRFAAERALATGKETIEEGWQQLTTDLTTDIATPIDRKDIDAGKAIRRYLTNAFDTMAKALPSMAVFSAIGAPGAYKATRQGGTDTDVAMQQSVAQPQQPPKAPETPQGPTPTPTPAVTPQPPQAPLAAPAAKPQAPAETIADKLVAGEALTDEESAEMLAGDEGKQAARSETEESTYQALDAPTKAKIDAIPEYRKNKILKLSTDRGIPVADFDMATGIPGRNYIRNEVTAAVDSQDKGILFFDLDKTKSMNEVYGHEAVDDVFEAVGSFMGKHFGNVPFGRQGGEEFVAILPADQADRVKAFFDDISSNLDIYGEPVTITAGFTKGRDDGGKMKASSLVEAAKNRKGGRNTLTIDIDKQNAYTIQGAVRGQKEYENTYNRVAGAEALEGLAEEAGVTSEQKDKWIAQAKELRNEYIQRVGSIQDRIRGREVLSPSVQNTVGRAIQKQEATGGVSGKQETGVSAKEQVGVKPESVAAQEQEVKNGKGQGSKVGGVVPGVTGKGDTPGSGTGTAGKKPAAAIPEAVSGGAITGYSAGSWRALKFTPEIEAMEPAQKREAVVAERKRLREKARSGKITDAVKRQLREADKVLGQYLRKKLGEVTAEKRVEAESKAVSKYAETGKPGSEKLRKLDADVKTVLDDLDNADLVKALNDRYGEKTIQKARDAIETGNKDGKAAQELRDTIANILLGANTQEAVEMLQARQEQKVEDERVETERRDRERRQAEGKAPEGEDRRKGERRAEGPSPAFQERGKHVLGRGLVSRQRTKESVGLIRQRTIRALPVLSSQMEIETAPPVLSWRSKGAEAAADAVGKSVVWFKIKPNTPLAKKNPGGFYNPSTPEYIYLNVEEMGRTGFMGSVMHELTHAVKNEAPEIYQAYLDVLESELTERGKEKREDTQQEYGDADVGKEEFVAELNGDIATQESFWRKLYERSPEAFQRVYEILQRILAEVKGYLGGANYPKFYVHRVEKVERALADMVEKFRVQRGDGGQGDVTFQGRGKKSVLDQLTDPGEDYKDDVEVVDYVARGYLLPDGNYLSIGAGQDHRFINGMVDLGKKLEDKFKNERTSKMFYIMRSSGAIRFLPETNSFQILKDPTREQMRAIGRYIKDNGSVEIELGENKPSRTYTEDNLFELEDDLGNIRFQRRKDITQGDLFGEAKTVGQLEAEEQQRLERAEVSRRQQERPGGEADLGNLPMFENQDIAGSQMTMFQRPASELEPILKKRFVRGDKLLDAIDLAKDMEAKGGKFTQDGNAIVYHRTTPENAQKIISEQAMTSKENGLFFGTKPTGQIEGYGSAVIRVEVPIEKLQPSDEFPNEYHVWMPTNTIGKKIKVKAEEELAFQRRAAIKAESEDAARKAAAAEGAAAPFAVAAEIQTEANRLRGKLANMGDDRLLDRAQIELQIKDYKDVNRDILGAAIIDYAQKIGIRGEPYANVDTLVKNAKTKNDLLKALDTIDERWGAMLNRTLLKKALSKVEDSEKYLKGLEGKKVSTTDLESNKNLREYIDNLKGADEATQAKARNLLALYNSTGQDKKTNREANISEYGEDVIRWIEKPSEAVPASVNTLLHKMFRARLQEMSNAELAQAVRDINEIRKNGRTERQAQMEKRAGELDELAAHIANDITTFTGKVPLTDVEKLSDKERGKSPRRKRADRILEAIDEFGYSMLDSERIIEGLVGFSRKSKIKDALWTPLWRGTVEEIKGMKAAEEKFKSLFRKMNMADVRMKPFIALKIQSPKTGQEQSINLSLEEMMFVYANSQNPGNRAHLVGTGFTEEAIESVTGALPKEYRDAVDKLIDWYDNEQYPRVSAQFEREHLVPMPKEHRYFPLLNLNSDRGESQIVVDMMARMGAKKAGVLKGFTKSRVGADTPFSGLKFFDTVLGNIKAVEHYVAMAEPTREVQRVLSDPNVKAAIQAKSKPAYASLGKWVKALAYGKIEGGDKIMNVLRNNYAAYVLGYKLTSVMAQTGSLPKAMGQLNKARFAGTLGRWISHPIKFMENVNELSPFMAARSRSFERDIAEQFEGQWAKDMLGVGSVADKVRETGMWTMGAYDKLLASWVWDAKYRESLSRTGNKQQAVDDADETVRKTQSGGGLISMPEWHRGSALARMLSQFKSDPSKTVNLLYEMAGKVRDRGYAKTALDAFWVLLAPAMLEYMIRHGFKPPWDEPEEVAREVVNNVVGGIPYFGQVIEAAGNIGIDKIGEMRGIKPDYRWTRNIGEVNIPALQGISSLSEGLAGEKIWAIADGLAAVAGVPGGGQVKRTVQGVQKMAEGKTDIRSLVWSESALKEHTVRASMKKRLKSTDPAEAATFLGWWRKQKPSARQNFREYFGPGMQEAVDKARERVDNAKDRYTNDLAKTLTIEEREKVIGRRDKLLKAQEKAK
jgi:GGDEF domain-containing protein